MTITASELIQWVIVVLLLGSGEAGQRITVSYYDDMMRHLARCCARVGGVRCVGVVVALTLGVNARADVSRGDYLLRVAGCHSCHTRNEEGAKPLAGGKAIETPFGTVFSSNITFSDQGIGGWSYAQFERALRHGERPQGGFYYPAFPYLSYRFLSDDDVLALFQALQTQALSRVSNRAPDLVWLFSSRILLTPWRWIHFGAVSPPQHTPVAPSAEYGAYLANAVTHCAECHSPRDAIGGIVEAKRWQGATLSSGHRAPNITPSAAGIGAWEAEEIAEYLRSGRSEYGRRARDEMKTFIEDGTRYLSDDDRLAIARYVQSLPTTSVRVKRGPRSAH